MNDLHLGPRVLAVPVASYFATLQETTTRRAVDVFLISAYAPTSAHSEDEWDAYNDSLSAALARCPPKAIAIIGSDANACIAAPRFNVVPVLCTPCSTPPLAEVLNMCNTTSELDVEHPRGPHRVQHVQHLFNTCLSQVLNNRKRDFSPPRAHWLSYPSIHGSSVCLWATVYVPSPEEVRQHQYTNA